VSGLPFADCDLRTGRHPVDLVKGRQRSGFEFKRGLNGLIAKGKRGGTIPPPFKAFLLMGAWEIPVFISASSG